MKMSVLKIYFLHLILPNAVKIPFIVNLKLYRSDCYQLLLKISTPDCYQFLKLYPTKNIELSN